MTTPPRGRPSVAEAGGELSGCAVVVDVRGQRGHGAARQLAGERLQAVVVGTDRDDGVACVDQSTYNLAANCPSSANNDDWRPDCPGLGMKRPTHGTIGGPFPDLLR